MATNGENGPGGAGGFARRLLLSVDAKGYGSADTVRQHEFQKAIVQLLELAAESAGLAREEWLTQEGGDSLFAVLPEGASEPALVDAFMRRLEAGLRAFNIGREPRAWLRLRAAVHFGETSPSANGFAGSAPVELGRIRDCAPLRAALDQLPQATLAVGLSATVFRDVVQGKAYTTIRENEFREVPVEEKEYRGAAWIWVPGADVRQVDLSPSVLEGVRRAANVARANVDVGALGQEANVTGVDTDRAGDFEAVVKTGRVGRGATVTGFRQTTPGGEL
ncbi:hypothetical protein DMH12_24150 [Streptomyces sp. WAC 04229]|uniref:hypothetical protein n=1 Tax=Streptomyces sp. WAC 04229 TaxID=2203206 RepID=UPI000F7388AB|nr:hypothetical protein [Streptomyces sp. WAC 04229]RSN50761.1 hypothetical protein DMH12_24150 [Streptomyces sp. WAC 04229]